MTKVLIVVSEWGYWGEELIGPLDACDKAGYEVEFLTPTGARPTPLAVSMSTDYVDPPQGKSVTAQGMAARTRELDASHRLDKPHNLADWVPARPYPSSPTYLRDMEAYYRAVERIVTHDLPAYDAMVIVGGSGAMVDLANNQRLHELVMGFVRLDKPVAAVCYGVATLAFARDPLRKQSLIRGKRVTGHPIDYDYHDGTGFEGPHAIDGSTQGLRRRLHQLRAAVLPAGVHPARRGRPGRRVHRQRRARRVGRRRLPVHHRPVDRVVRRVRAGAGRRPRQRPAPIRLVIRMRLAGHKIAILIESDFYEHEIWYYPYRFPEEGAEVHFLTRLWGQPSLTFTGHEYKTPFVCTESFENMDDETLRGYSALIVPVGDGVRPAAVQREPRRSCRRRPT